MVDCLTALLSSPVWETNLVCGFVRQHLKGVHQTFTHHFPIFLDAILPEGLQNGLFYWPDWFGWLKFEKLTGPKYKLIGAPKTRHAEQSIRCGESRRGFGQVEMALDSSNLMLLKVVHRCFTLACLVTDRIICFNSHCSSPISMKNDSGQTFY